MAKNNKAEKTKMNSDLMEIVKILNGKFEDNWADMIKPNLAVFPIGQVWICDECDAIHIGFHLNTMPGIIGEIAIALVKYESRLSIESLPVFIDGDGNVFEGEEAFVELGKMFVSAFACSDCTAEIVEAKQIVEPNNGASMIDKRQDSLIHNEFELVLDDLIKLLSEAMQENRATVQMTRQLIQEIAKLGDVLKHIQQMGTAKQDFNRLGSH